MKYRFSRYAALAAALAIAFTVDTSANHNWSKYHWAKSTAVLSLQVGDNVGSQWDPYLDEAIFDWNTSAVLDLRQVTGGADPAVCEPTAGRIEACNAAYGDNGWLGIAQIWLASGSHISQAVDEAERHLLQYRRPTTRRPGGGWSRARRSLTTSDSITRTSSSTTPTSAPAWTTRTIRMAVRAARPAMTSRTSIRTSTTSIS